MKDLNHYVQKIIASIENPRIPFLYHILLFAAAINLRNFLEIFSTRASISFQLFPSHYRIYFFAWVGMIISLLHFTIFWIDLALAIGIIVFFITREKIGNILKAIFSFYFILCITPIVDLIISGGAGRNIAYAKPQNIVEFLLIPRILTPGMMVTSITALILIFLYCKLKTHNWKKASLASLLVYVLLLIGSVLPSILKTSHPVPIIRTLFILFFIELAIVFYLIDKKIFLALVKDVRWLRLLYFEAIFILGIVLTSQPLLKVILANWDSFLLTLISIAFAWLSSLMFNNIEDEVIDKISNPQRPLVTEQIPANLYLKIALSFVSLALVSGLAVNFQTFLFSFILVGSSFFYCLPPLRFKRIPLFSKIFISFNCLILTMLGFIFAGQELLKFPSIFIWYFLIFVTLALNFIDLKDYAGDKVAGIPTLPVILGLQKAKILAATANLLAYGMLAFIFLDFRLFLPSLILGVIQFLLINRKTYQEKPVLITHIVGIFLLLIYLSLSATGKI